VEDVDPVVVVEEFDASKSFDVGAEESDNDNYNDEVGFDYGCESFKVVSIRDVGGGCYNSTIKESSCVMDSFD
jgi:hypothetical protein